MGEKKNSLSQELLPSITAVTSATSHTPGPWYVFGDPCDAPGIEAEGDFSVVVYGDVDEAAGYGVQGRTREEQWANARLLAAGPEMLEALELAAAQFRKYERLHLDKATEDGARKADTNRGYAEVCEIAIAKATLGDRIPERSEGRAAQVAGEGSWETKSKPPTPTNPEGQTDAG